MVAEGVVSIQLPLHHLDSLWFILGPSIARLEVLASNVIFKEIPRVSFCIYFSSSTTTVLLFLSPGDSEKEETRKFGQNYLFF